MKLELELIHSYNFLFIFHILGFSFIDVDKSLIQNTENKIHVFLKNEIPFNIAVAEILVCNENRKQSLTSQIMLNIG